VGEGLRVGEETVANYGNIHSSASENMAVKYALGRSA